MNTNTGFRVGRIYNAHGVADYYLKTDENCAEYFSSRKVAAVFGAYSDAWNKAAALKEKIPTLLSGAEINYVVEEA